MNVLKGNVDLDASLNSFEILSKFGAIFFVLFSIF